MNLSKIFYKKQKVSKIFGRKCQVIKNFLLKTYVVIRKLLKILSYRKFAIENIDISKNFCGIYSYR